MRAAAAVLVALPCLALHCLVAAAPAAAAPHPRFFIGDPRIDEASGIAVGIRSSALYVQNDSGDEARFFALDGDTGETRAVYTVAGARNVDWEDIAVSRDVRGTPSVWLADIGDNGAKRGSVQLYRVDEPAVSRTSTPTQRTIGPADVWRLRYPDGPHDAETLIVDGSGHAFVVTKSVLGVSHVYAVPPTASARVQTMRDVGVVRFQLTSTPGPFGPVGHLTATGGSFGDGVVVIRTYTDAYVWAAPKGVVAALRGKPAIVPLPRQKQGEGVCVRAAGALLVDSEGADSPVYQVGFAPPEGRPSTSPVGTNEGGSASPITGTQLLLLLAGAGFAVFALGFLIRGAVALILRRRRV